MTNIKALKKAVNEFDPMDFDLSAICHHEEHQVIDYQVGFGEAWVDYSAQIWVRDLADCWEFTDIEITDLKFNDMDQEFTENELESAIKEAKFNY